MPITNILLFFLITITVINTVYTYRKGSKEAYKTQCEIRDLRHLLCEDRKVIEDLIEEEKKTKKDIDITKRDIEAIADSINVYSKSITGNVAEKVKDNINLFNEWISGEVDE